MKAHLPALATLTLLLAACHQAPVSPPAPPAAHTGGAVKAQDLVIVNINGVVPTGNVTKEPGQTGSASFYLDPTNGDGKQGCNATGNGGQVTFSLASSDPSVIANAGPSSPITGCGSLNARSLTYTVNPDAPVGTVVTLTVSAAGAQGTNTAARFTPSPARRPVRAAPAPRPSPSNATPHSRTSP